MPRLLDRIIDSRSREVSMWFEVVWECCKIWIRALCFVLYPRLAFECWRSSDRCCKFEGGYVWVLDFNWRNWIAVEPVCQLLLRVNRNSIISDNHWYSLRLLLYSISHIFIVVLPKIIIIEWTMLVNFFRCNLIHFVNNRQTVFIRGGKSHDIVSISITLKHVCIN